MQSQSAFREEFTPEVGRNGSMIVANPIGHDLPFATSTTANTSANLGPSKVGTLKKQHSFIKQEDVPRKSSRRSMRAVGAKGIAGTPDDDFNNVFRIPIPTNANPTEVLANRFQAWRKLLKDLITYFREVQISYEGRSKGMIRVSNIINSINAPSILRAEGGLEDALATLRGYSKHALAESNKSREIQEDVITQLNGLRNDLNQKIKEIKSLAGDFRNNVDREKDVTRRQVDALREAIASADKNPIAATGKNDPFLIRLAVERQVAKQIEEENYLHRAYLNLENSGRELESIVVGEIQKAYNALATIMKRESDAARDAAEELRVGPLSIPKDYEWTAFVEHDNHFVDPQIPIRKIQNIYYPGMDDPTAAEIRGGMLERKSKYLKSYTPGWYVLSPTHLHEFKSADHIHTQTPVMSLYLMDQKLGSHSQAGASSHKFSLKGRQTGSMHRGHSWVFRAESHESMIAWYSDIQTLTEKTGEEKLAFVKRHARTVSAGSKAVSISSGFDDDEADAVPYSAQGVVVVSDSLKPQSRPSPGGRFPSDIDVNRGLNAPMSPSSDTSSIRDRTPVIIASALPSEPMFAGERRDVRHSAYLTPERARASPTPERQRATPTPDRLKTTPSPGPRTAASGGPRSRQVSRDEPRVQELFTEGADTPGTVPSPGVNGYVYEQAEQRRVTSVGSAAIVGVVGSYAANNRTREATPERSDITTFSNNNHTHQSPLALAEAPHFSTHRQAQFVAHPNNTIHPRHDLATEYSERSHGPGGHAEDRLLADRPQTASSSIYGAYDGPSQTHHESAVVNGDGPTKIEAPISHEMLNVMSGPAPTFNQARYDPLVESGLGISSGSQTTNGSAYGNVAFRSNEASRTAAKTNISPPPAVNGEYGLPFPGGKLSRQGTTNTVGTISALDIPGAFPRTA